MPEFCTCGAQLLPDARFCHKCGKPQREEPAPLVEETETEPPVVEPIAAPPPSPPEIGLRNSLAVRVGFLVGSATFVLSLLPFPVVQFVCLLASGACSVYLYNRRSGRTVEIMGGARMGWITGLFCFVIFTVLFTISVAVLSAVLRDPNVEQMYRTQLGSMGMSLEKIQQAMEEVLQSPVQVLGTLLSAFVILTMVPAVGGMLGARLFRRN